MNFLPTLSLIDNLTTQINYIQEMIKQRQNSDNPEQASDEILALQKNLAELQQAQKNFNTQNNNNTSKILFEDRNDRITFSREGSTVGSFTQSPINAINNNNNNRSRSVSFTRGNSSFDLKQSYPGPSLPTSSSFVRSSQKLTNYENQRPMSPLAQFGNMTLSPKMGKSSSNSKHISKNKVSSNPFGDDFTDEED